MASTFRTYVAKHNVEAHTVTIHKANCSCVASGSVWTILAATPAEARGIASEDAPNVSKVFLAPCCSVTART